jgi:hypothetical protein
MQQYKDWEKDQMQAIEVPKIDAMYCQKCKCTWWQKIHAVKIDANKFCTLGQEPVSEASFVILKCVRCGELHEPPISRVFNHPEGKLYDKMLDELQQPKEQWKPNEAKKAE